MAEQGTVSNDEHARRASADAAESWHVSIARFLGWATGRATMEAQAVGRRTTDAARGAFESRASDARRASELVRELMEMAVARSHEGPEALEREPDFWRLIRELDEAHCRARHASQRESDPQDVDASATRHADAIDVEVTEPREAVDARLADVENDDAAPEPEAEFGVTDGEDSEDSVRDEPRATRRRARKEESE